MTSPIVAFKDIGTLGDETRLIDARRRSEWAAGHLVGAVSADLEVELSAPTADPSVGGRHPLPELSDWCGQLGRWGVESDTPVVVYDDAGGGNAAARCWWMLRAVGHRPAFVLDGGLAAAIAAGGQKVTDLPAVAAAAPYPVRDPRGWDPFVIAADELDLRRRDPDVCVIDVRAESRYRGESDPFDPNPGHVPGAVNRPYPANLEAGRWRSAGDLRAAYEELLDGRLPEDTVVYCGSGVTACHTLLALEAAGLPGARLYVGSWSEWGRSARPKASFAASRTATRYPGRPARVAAPPA